MTINIILSLISFIAMFAAFYFKKKSDNIEREISELLQVYNSDEGKVIQESFLKFVSDSRDWAFQYIEDAQQHLKNFQDAVENDIKYFDDFGIVGSAYPHYESMKRISTAYKELIKILPEEDNDKA